MARILSVSDGSDRFFNKTYQAHRIGKGLNENKTTATCPTDRIGTYPIGRISVLF